MNRSLLAIVTTCSLLALATPRDARACGGCFAPPQADAPQVVTDHRMVLAIHADETILWDQIRYAGKPSEFSWVLPVAGDVTVEVGSTGFFTDLDRLTAVRVQSPAIRTSCPATTGGGCGGSTRYLIAEGNEGGSEHDAVQVLREAVVGPYETVTLRGSDANALETWLSSHGYAIPTTVRAVVESYVAMRMDFVALRLAPGEDASAMQPVRVRYPGANMVLPLRMIAAGAADKLGITLWVFGSGRYEAGNFANALVDPDDLVWDWDAHRSNYPEAFERALARAGGRAFVTEYSGSPTDAVPTDGAGNPIGAEDWGLARGGGDASAPYARVTRLRTDLPVALLDADLVLRASADPSEVGNEFTARKTTGTYPGVACAAISLGASPEEALDHPARTLAGAAASVLAAVWLRRRRAH